MYAYIPFTFPFVPFLTCQTISERLPEKERKIRLVNYPPSPVYIISFIFIPSVRIYPFYFPCLPFLPVQHSRSVLPGEYPSLPVYIIAFFSFFIPFLYLFFLIPLIFLLPGVRLYPFHFLSYLSYLSNNLEASYLVNIRPHLFILPHFSFSLV